MGEEGDEEGADDTPLRSPSAQYRKWRKCYLSTRDTLGSVPEEVQCPCAQSTA